MANCFVCSAEINGPCTPLVTGLTKYSNTSFANCLSEVLGNSYCIIVSETDLVCENCANICNERDRLSKILTDNLKKKFGSVCELPSNLVPDVEPQDLINNDQNLEAYTLSVKDDLNFGPWLEEQEAAAVFGDYVPTPKDSDVSANKIEEQLSCDFCQKIFENKEKLLSHLKKAHLTQDVDKVCVGQCDSCSTLFETQADADDHLTPRIRGIENYCNVCNEEFVNKIAFASHCSNYHGTETFSDSVKIFYVCKCCSAEFETYSSFGRHVRTHKAKRNEKNKSKLCTNKVVNTGPKKDKLSEILPKPDDDEEAENPTMYEITGIFNTPSLGDAMDLTSVEQISNDDMIPLEDAVASVGGASTLQVKKIYQCGLCTARYESVSDLKMHFLTHSEPNSRCDICKIDLNTNAEQKFHYIYHWKPGMNWQCKKCDLICTDLRSTKEHLKRKHKYAHDCYYCGHMFQTNDKLNDHEKNHPDYKRYCCEECDMKFHCRDDLNTHISDRHCTLPCNTCGTRFSTPQSRKRHECPLNPNRTVYECQFCDKKFRSRSGYRDHELTHTQSYKQHCVDCDKPFLTKRAYTEHCNAVHSTKPDALYTCEICGKPFLYLHSYIFHKKSHLKPFSYICEYCGQVIKNEAYVKIHLRKHTGELPFKCPYCPKAFTNGSYLRRHMMAHTKQYAYECQDCKKGFIDRKPYLKHREKDHGDMSLNETCDLCKDLDTIGKNSIFLLHRNKVHGEPLPKKVPTVKLSSSTKESSVMPLSMPEIDTDSAADDLIRLIEGTFSNNDDEVEKTPDAFMDTLESIQSQTVEIVVME